MIWEWICILDEITGILDLGPRAKIDFKDTFHPQESFNSIPWRADRMARDEELETLFSPICYNEPWWVKSIKSAPEALSESQFLADRKQFLHWISKTFSLSTAQRKTLCNIYRSVEKENSPPDEEMVEGLGRMLCPATTRIRPEFRLRNQTKRTQCDKIKAKPTLRCHLKIVCSRFLLNCPRHLSRIEVPLHCSSRSSVSDELCKRPCFASCSVQPKGKMIIFRLP